MVLIASIPSHRLSYTFYIDIFITGFGTKYGNIFQVQLSADRTSTFALKCLKKKHIVDTRQQEHIYSEKKIMMECRSPFITR